MKHGKKIVRLGTVKMHHSSTGIANVYCKIEWDGQKLSISGVEGPLSNGDALGSCGQIDMHLRGNEERITPAPGWDLAMLKRFFAVWDEWHLNDMKAYDLEMKAAGWDKLALREMRGYKFTLKLEIIQHQRALKEWAEKVLLNGNAAQYTPGQIELLQMPYEYVVWTYEGEPEPTPREGYERAKDLRTGNVAHPERKTLSWVYPKEHPDGLLTRKLREDGPAFGSAWYFHPVPAEVIEFLNSLPETDQQPAWV